jgi:hypothetical protein
LTGATVTSYSKLLGWGGVGWAMNTGRPANCKAEKMYDKTGVIAIVLRLLCDVCAGDELTVEYGTHGANAVDLSAAAAPRPSSASPTAAGLLAHVVAVCFCFLVSFITVSR